MRVDHRRAGVTLVELMIVLVLVGILVSIAAPSARRMIERAEANAALNQLVAELSYTRMLAVRTGYGTELRLVRGPTCPAPRLGRIAADRYLVVARDPAPRVVRETRVRHAGRGACLESNGDPSIRFNPRGMLVPFENRTVAARSGDASAHLTMSVLGRILRRY